MGKKLGYFVWVTKCMVLVVYAFYALAKLSFEESIITLICTQDCLFLEVLWVYEVWTSISQVRALDI